MDCHDNSYRIAQQIYTKICFNPTNNQKNIVEKVSSWLCSSDSDSIFILNGYAGTGKTTIIAAIVAAMDDLKMRTCLLAPTGRAANVLSRYSKRPAHTIHRHIYNEKTNAQYESKFSLGFNKHQDILYIVDEASMLSHYSAGDGAQFGSGSLLDDLVEFVRKGRNCRLMLVGDNAQLPPVGISYSPALDATFMGRYGEVVYGTMDEVVRQEANSGILYNATFIRCMMEQGIIDIPKLNFAFPDIECINGGEFTEKMQECYDKYGRDETVIITRSNKRANRYNEGVRRFTICAEEAIESGDMVMIVKNNYFYTEQDKDCPMGFIANGDVACIDRIRNFRELYGFNFAEATLSFGDHDNTQIDCKILLDTISAESPSLSQADSQRLLHEVEQDYIDINSKIERFKQIRKNEYFNALQVKFAYAVTCHKAQGGQWKAVFIDQCIFGDEEMSQDMMRWLYTAFTRATEKLYLVSYDERFIDETTVERDDY
ncbi:MAG: AAA family ATPase [Rikenellaceae bacterium]